MKNAGSYAVRCFEPSGFGFSQGSKGHWVRGLSSVGAQKRQLKDPNKNMGVSGIVLVMGLGTRIQAPSVCVVFEAPSQGPMSAQRHGKSGSRWEEGILSTSSTLMDLRSAKGLAS